MACTVSLCDYLTPDLPNKMRNMANISAAMPPTASKNAAAEVKSLLQFGVIPT